jgi:hypothetical protein
VRSQRRATLPSRLELHAGVDAIEVLQQLGQVGVPGGRGIPVVEVEVVEKLRGCFSRVEVVADNPATAQTGN